MLLPVDLAVYYPLITLPLWKAGVAALLLAVVLGLCFKHLRSRPWLAVGVLWFLVTLSPVIGLVQVADQAMADRYTYLPLIGLFMVTAWGGADLYQRNAKWRSAVSYSAAGILLCCAVVTNLQVSYWEDNVRLIRYSLANTRESFFAYRILGAAYEQAGQPHRAVEPYRMALRINPSDPGTHNNLANILDNEGSTSEAVEEYQAALRLSPHFALAHFNLGLVLERAGSLKRAEAEFYQAVQEMPDFRGGHECLGRCLCKDGRLNEGIAELRTELHLHPDQRSARATLALALRQKNLLRGG